MPRFSPDMNVMIKAAEKASRSLIRDFGEVEQLQVSRKGPGDFVTAADLRSEEIIHNELSYARPDFGFLMEERGEIKGQDDKQSRFIVDPLDGTSNFLHGIPHWNITIALEQNGEIIAGLVYDPVRDEMFTAEKGQGAFLQHKRLRVSGRNNLAEASIACNVPGKNKPFYKKVTRQIDSMTDDCFALRRFGAAALDLSYVAAGRFEAYWEYGLKPWDVAAGTLIVREAGGMISTINGKGSAVYEGNVIAANAALFDDVKKRLYNAEKADNKAA